MSFQDGSSFLQAIAQSAALAASSTTSGASSRRPGNEYVTFSGDSVDSVPLRGTEVTVMTTATGDHDVGSSKLTIRNLVNFGWEHVYVPGQLVAANITGEYLAYGIVTPGKKEPVVRVVARKSEKRVLLKGMQGQIKDLAFAYTTSEVILGCVDDTGSLFVFLIKDEKNMDSALQYEPILQIYRTEETSDKIQRIIWCPYLIEDEQEDETAEGSPSKLLVLIHGSQAEMLNVSIISKKYGAEPLSPSAIAVGRLVVEKHSHAICDASFSPDGSALATASEDGTVRFYQVYMLSEESPRCLHQWTPHGGKPVTSFFFLDDHKARNPDAKFWKYAITGSNNNSELKLWSCESWTCLQTIRFQPPGRLGFTFKAVLDLSAKYLLLSEIFAKIVYVIHLVETDDSISAVSVSEFPSPSPFLSMSVLDAGLKKVTDLSGVRNGDEDDDVVEVEDLREFMTGEKSNLTVIDLLLVQPKSLQECRIVYADACNRAPIKKESLDFDEPNESKVKMEMISPASIKKEPSAHSNGGRSNEISLMSPDAFVPLSAQAIKKEEPQSPELQQQGRPFHDEIICPPDVARAKRLLRSGNSSPSREVRDILGDSEEQGGLGADVVITYEDDDGEDRETDDLEDPDEDEDDDDKKPRLLDPLSMASPSAPAQAAAQLHKSLDWPQPPIASGIKLEVNSEDRMMSRSFDAQFPAAPLNQPPGAIAAIAAPAVLELVMKRMNDMTSLIQTQRAEIQVLREEMRAMRGSDRSDLEQIVVAGQKRFADAVKKQDSEAARGTAADVCGAVRSELKKLAPSIAQQTANSLHKSLEQDVHARSAKASATVQEAIVRAAQSKAVTDSLALAALPHVQEAFREAFANVIVPGFERGLQAMLNQVSAVFVKGAKEHETVLAQMRKSLTDQVAKELQHSLSKLQRSEDDSAARELMVEQVVARVQEVILPELNRSLARNLAATPMTAVPPSPDTPSLSTQRMVKEHVRQGNYDAAFQVALSASNLPLVVATCEMVNPVQVFDQSECPLSQNVLLALVQQLGHNLEDKTEVKYRYLEQGLINLDTTNPTIRHHMSSVLSGLATQLHDYVASHPNEKITKRFKWLLKTITPLMSDSE